MPVALPFLRSGLDSGVCASIAVPEDAEPARGPMEGLEFREFPTNIDMRLCVIQGITCKTENRVLSERVVKYGCSWVEVVLVLVLLLVLVLVRAGAAAAAAFT